MGESVEPHHAAAGRDARPLLSHGAAPQREMEATLDGGVKSMGDYPKMGADWDYSDFLIAPVKW